MAKYETGSKFFEEEGPKDVELFVEWKMKLFDKIYDLMEKVGIEELSKLSGIEMERLDHIINPLSDISLREIAKLSVALNHNFIEIL